jgi:TRAP-type C4-dicarboxylate transport system permease small subunit
MNKILSGFCWVVDRVIATLLLIMVVLVFGNVVLRYGFNSGITLSEEVSRWLFIWMTFLGAIVAIKERAHLGTDMLVSRLAPKGKKICLAASYVLMLFITGTFLKGSWDQAIINLDVQAPVTGASIAIFYSAGVAFSLIALLLLLAELFRVLSGEMTDEELVMVKESEEQGELEALQAQLARENASANRSSNK